MKSFDPRPFAVALAIGVFAMQAAAPAQAQRASAQDIKKQQMQQIPVCTKK